ncbi:MAG: hypothetical protein ACRD29_16120 [Acidimicrobiales bacterium]
MSALERALLIVGLLAPLAVLVPSFGKTPRPEVSRRWARAGNGASLLAWLAVLAFGLEPELGALAPDSLAVATAAGAALVGLAVAAVGGVGELVATGVALTVLGAGACVTVDGAPSVPAVGLALVVVVVIDAVARRPWLIGMVVAAAGLALLGGAVWALGGTTALPFGARNLGDPRLLAPDTGPLVVLAIGCVLIGLVAATTPRRPLALLLPGGLAVAARVLPAVHDADGAAWLSVVLAGAATALTVVASSDPGSRRLPAMSLGSPVVASLAMWTVAAAATPLAGSSVAAALLGAAAVIAVPLPPVVAALVGLPGAALLVGMVAEGGWLPVTIAVLVPITGWALARRHCRPVDVALTVSSSVAGVLGFWLIVLPETWSWTGDVERTAVDRYQEGALVAMAAALVVAVAVAIVTSRRPTREPAFRRAKVANSAALARQNPEGSRIPIPAVAVTGALLGVAGWFLIASLLR